MRITQFLYNFNKVGELTKLYSNLPERYIKRSMEQVYYRNPKGHPRFPEKKIERKKYRFSVHRPWTTEFHQENAPGRYHPKIFLEPVGEWSFFKGDRVEVMVGKDKGKQGLVIQVIQERNWVIVEGLNTTIERMGETKTFPGIVYQKEEPLLVTNEVKHVDPETLQATEIEWRYTEEGNKVRVSTSTSRIIPIPIQAYETKDYKTKNSYIDNATKDTSPDALSEITYKPALKTFEMEIMEEKGIKEDRVPGHTYWY